MSKTIAIFGAGGTQGGGVANILFKTAGWKVRAITRNASSDKAKALADQGAEVVAADFNDEASLAKALEGAQAAFVVTNFWEFLFTGKNQAESGTAEADQAFKVAQVAAKSSSLEHYIFSTLPDAGKLTNGKHPVPHFDYKAKVDERIKKELPELAKKTTFLYFGYYPQNMAFFPMLKPFELPGSYGAWIQTAPASPNTKIPASGDMSVTPGIWVRQILAKPEVSKGKYALVAPEKPTFAEMMKTWSEVTGRRGVFVQVSPESYGEVWGIGGAELATQLQFGEVIDDWTTGVDSVSQEELGIKSEEVPGVKQVLEGFKAAGLL